MVENQHSVGASQLGLKSVYQYNESAKFIAGCNFHSMTAPVINLATSLRFHNLYMKPEITIS